MPDTPTETADLLFPLSTFEGIQSQGTTKATVIPSEQLPQPYHKLLVHDRDMTGTLEAHFDEPMVLHVLKKRIDDGVLFRQVLLRGVNSGRTAEFGAIRIELDCFDPEARLLIEACHQPLGGILRERAIAYISAPSAFLQVEADSFVREALGAGLTTPLFGRKNTLTTADGRTMAQIIEVLPPLPPG